MKLELKEQNTVQTFTFEFPWNGDTRRLNIVFLNGQFHETVGFIPEVNTLEKWILLGEISKLIQDIETNQK